MKNFVLQVRYEIMFEMFKRRSIWLQLTVSLVLNWIVGPLLMTGLAWATLPDLDHYRNGDQLPKAIIMIARCCLETIADIHRDHCSPLL